MVESNRSERPLFEHTFRSAASSANARVSVAAEAPGMAGSDAGPPCTGTCAFWCFGAPLLARNARDRSTMASPRQVMRMRGSSVTVATTVASSFSSRA